MPTIHLLIKGKVQGVFYRKSAKEVAEKNGITGWVRNTAEGNVEAKATGSNEALQLFVAWCHNGPSRAVVSEVKVAPMADEQFDKFEVRRG